MGSLFSRPRIPPMPTPKPPPEPPVIEEQLEPLESDIARRRAKLSRPKTIITGDLTPEMLGKKRLLGG